jgi:branched-chain amino acid transport system ATP-binding protein
VTVLEITDLEVRYGAVEAVRGVSLHLGANQTLGLLGPNGAGKSSLLRAISGLTSYRGSIKYDGREVRRVGPEALASAGLVHVPEGRRLFPSLTVHENLQMGEIARARREAFFRIDDAYDLFSALTALRNRQAWTLSGGEQQMVAVSRALVACPRLLLLDEPSLGLAPIVVDIVFDALKSVADRVPMLLVEQNTSKSLQLCAEAAVLVNGSIVLSGPSAELGDRRALLDRYLGKEELDQ